MAKAYKNWGITPTATSLTSLYVVPAATSTVCSSLTVCNKSDVLTSYRFSINGFYIAYDATIDGNETRVFTIGMSLAATNEVKVYATLATLDFVLFGCEIT